MSIDRNGSDDNSDLRQRLLEPRIGVDLEALDQNADLQRTRTSFHRRVLTGMRNVLFNPLTIGGVIVGAVGTGYLLPWLFGASSSSSNALSSGIGPALDGTPPPPVLNLDQAGGTVPHPAPLGGSPAPALEDILRNAGYTEAEQQQLAAEGASASAHADPLPQCPEEIFFIAPSDSPGSPSIPSQTRNILTNGEVGDYCSGPAPRFSVQRVSSNIPRYLCRDQDSGEALTACAISNPNISCPAGQELVQCSGFRQGEWASEVGSVCLSARRLVGEPTIVLENVDTPQASDQVPTHEEMTMLDTDIRQHCPEYMRIYSEEPPFAGTSDWAQSRIQFRATPRDILQGRNRAFAAAQQAEPTPEDPVQEEQTPTEDRAQGSSEDYERQGARPKFGSNPRKPK